MGNLNYKNQFFLNYKITFLAVLIFTLSVGNCQIPIPPFPSAGGEITYKYLGQGSKQGTLKYSVSLKLYKYCSSIADYDYTSAFTVFKTTTNEEVETFLYVDRSSIRTIQRSHANSCIPDLQEDNTCLNYNIYQTVIDNLPVSPGGYTVSYQRCCHYDFANIEGSGITYFVQIPGNAIPEAEKNSSAQFTNRDDIIICAGQNFKINYSATDPDSDSLSYSFSPGYSGAGTQGFGTGFQTVRPHPTSRPPYDPYTYYSLKGFFSSSPLGNKVSIDHTTGIISGVAPYPAGDYSVTVLAKEFKNGVEIGSHLKEIPVKVAQCNIPDALIEREYINCKDNKVAFSNLGTSKPGDVFHWDFGVTGIASDTSFSAAPTFNYPDTGIYRVTLKISRNIICADSTTAVVKIYPGFYPGFTVTGLCQNTPAQFTDTTKSRYGSVNYWVWDFGIPKDTLPRPKIKNPSLVYLNPGNYDTWLLVKTDKGCNETVYKTISIRENPLISLAFTDTAFCQKDTIQLNAASGGGSFSWKPLINIIKPNSPGPFVYPASTTKYFVTHATGNGCSLEDSILVKVVPLVTIDAGNDTTVCTTDSIILQPQSDALKYLWTPSNTLSSATEKNPVAMPVVSTVYHVTGITGKCKSEDSLLVTIVPYPRANAGADISICNGTSIQLYASGGNKYNWTPGNLLNDPGIQNPVTVKLSTDMLYTVYVSDTLAGCSKSKADSVFIKVYPKVIADAGPADTLTTLSQPLQLQATGGDHFLWTPSSGLSNPLIANPIAGINEDKTYTVTVTNAIGCSGIDSIKIKLYKVVAGIYVPNAFTPNNDGINDIFRPILLGVKYLNYFQIYNRSGQLVFSFSKIHKEWDGTFNGKPLNAGVYVWVAEGVDFRDLKILRKGSVNLIR
jgi:gliding motility-associated-like protein